MLLHFRFPPPDWIAACGACLPGGYLPAAAGNDASVWRDGWYPATAKAQTAAARRTDFSSFAMGGTAPGLVIQGLQDKIAPPQNAWNLVNRRQNTRLVALPNMGHAMLPEQPAALANAVIDFLNSQHTAK